MLIDTGTADQVKGDGLPARISGHAAIVAEITNHAEKAHAERQTARDQADANRVDRRGLDDGP